MAGASQVMPWWEWQDDVTTWTAFYEADVGTIERLYNESGGGVKETRDMSWNRGYNTMYRYDFRVMKQINTESKKTRMLRRLEVPCCAKRHKLELKEKPRHAVKCDTCGGAVPPGAEKYYYCHKCVMTKCLRCQGDVMQKTQFKDLREWQKAFVNLSRGQVDRLRGDVAVRAQLERDALQVVWRQWVDNERTFSSDEGKNTTDITLFAMSPQQFWHPTYGKSDDDCVVFPAIRAPNYSDEVDVVGDTSGIQFDAKNQFEELLRGTSLRNFLENLGDFIPGLEQRNWSDAIDDTPLQTSSQFSIIPAPNGRADVGIAAFGHQCTNLHIVISPSGDMGWAIEKPGAQRIFFRDASGRKLHSISLVPEEREDVKEAFFKLETRDETVEEEKQRYEKVQNRLVHIQITMDGVASLEPSAHGTAGRGNICPKGHTLVEFRTPGHKSHICDMCNQHLPANSRMFGCRPCDFDHCYDCWLSLLPKDVKTKELQAANEVKEVCYKDTDGDAIVFRLEEGKMVYYVNNKPKVRNLTELRIEGLTIHIDGTSCGSWAPRRVTKVPTTLPNRHNLLNRLKNLWSESLPAFLLPNDASDSNSPYSSAGSDFSDKFNVPSFALPDCPPGQEYPDFEEEEDVVAHTGGRGRGASGKASGKGAKSSLKSRAVAAPAAALSSGRRMLGSLLNRSEKTPVAELSENSWRCDRDSRRGGSMPSLRAGGFNVRGSTRLRNASPPHESKESRGPLIPRTSSPEGRRCSRSRSGSAEMEVASACAPAIAECMMFEDDSGDDCDDRSRSRGTPSMMKKKKKAKRAEKEQSRDRDRGEMDVDEEDEGFDCEGACYDGDDGDDGGNQTMESGLLLAVVKRGAEICAADESDNVPKGARRKAGVSVRVTFMYYGLAGDGQISAERTRRFTQQANFRRRELGLPHGSLVSGLGSWGGPENAPIKLFGFRLMDAVDGRRALKVIEGVSAISMPADITAACNQLQGVVPNVSNSAKQAERAAQGLTKKGCKASLSQIAALYLYTMETAFYRQLNAAMRDEDRSKAEPFFGYLRLLFSGLEVLSMTSGKQKAQSLYRGVNLNLADDHPEGSEVVWWGASSCTPKLAVAKGFLGSAGDRTLFHVRQQSAVPIKEYSAFRGEEEWLLAPGTRLTVESVKKQKGGMTEVHLVELAPPRAIR